MQYPTLSIQDAFIRASGMKSTNIVPAAWEIAGEFSAAEIREAVERVVARHQALRASIVEEADGSYSQRVVDDVAIKIDPVDLKADADAEPIMSWLMGEHLADPFDLATAPLWRGFLAHVAEDRWVLGLAFAHVIMDGASVSVFSGDLAHALGRSTQPEPFQLDAIVATEKEVRVTEEHTNWWADQYATRRSLAAGWGGDRAHFRVAPVPTLPPHTVAGLRRLVEGQGASISTGFGALVAVVALAVLEADRPALGFATGQRNPSNQSAFGPLHDHLPVVVDTAAPMSFTGLVRDVHERRAAARQHRLPTGKLEAIANGTPYDIAVNYRPFQAPAPQLVADRGTVTARPIATIGHVGVWRPTSVAPVLAAILRPGRADVSGDVTGVSKLFDPMKVRELARALPAITERALGDPEGSVGSLVRAE